MLKVVTLAGVAFGSDFDAEERAKNMAADKFDRFYATFGGKIRTSTHTAIREMYLDRGFTCYLIRIQVDLNDADMCVLTEAKRLLLELERIGEYAFSVS